MNIEINEITIKDETQQQNYAVIISKKQLVEIVRKFWFQRILIKIRQTNFGGNGFGEY